MIGRLTGKVDGDVVMVGGIGFDVRTPQPLPDGEDVTLAIHTAVRQEDITLYGFSDPADRDLFEALCAVSSVGPAMALSLLADVGRNQIVDAVDADTPRPLTAARGVGTKSARMVVASLKVPQSVRDATDGEPVDADDDGARQAIDLAVAALVSMGDDRDQARAAVRRAAEEVGTDDSGTLVQAALRQDS